MEPIGQVQKDMLASKEARYADLALYLFPIKLVSLSFSYKEFILVLTSDTDF